MADGKVYVAGHINNSAKLWVDGVMTDCTNSKEESRAYGVTVHNGEVYVVGYEGEHAMLWKNKTPIRLDHSMGRAFAYSVVVN